MKLATPALGAGVTSAFAYGTTHPYYPTRYTSPQGNALTYDYDAKGNLARVTDATVGAGATTMAYNANGTIVSSTDPNGKQMTYGYDAKGNRTRVTPPAPMGETRYTYDTASRVTSVRDGNGHTTRYSYDVLDRVTKVVAHDGTQVVYAYDKVGKRTKQTDPSGTRVSVFNRFDEVTEERLHSAWTARYTYDKIGNMSSMSDAGGKVSYTHNAVNLLTVLVEPDGARTTFEYDARNNRRFTRYPNGVVQEGVFDASNRLREIIGRDATGATLTRAAYTYTKSGTDTALRHTLTDHNGATTTYGYDPLDRLTSAVTRSSADAITRDLGYGYDAASNRTRESVDAATTTATFNAANQLTARGGATYTYDGAGQQTGSSAGAQLGYNTFRQTTSMRRAGGSAISASYAGADQRVRAAAAGETLTTTLLGVTVKTPPSGAATPRQHYVRDDTGGLIGVREAGTGGKRGYYLFDGLGSIAAITNAATGAVVNRYTYDPYGQTSEQQLSGALDNPWRFTGEFQDTATGLYKIGARYLDTTLGRWTQQDPSERERNTYLYASADPINRTDPSGCASLPCALCQSAVGVVLDQLCTLPGLVACSIVCIVGGVALYPYCLVVCAVAVSIGCSWLGSRGAAGACRYLGFC